MPAKKDVKKTEKILAEARKRRQRKKIINVEEEKVKIVICLLGEDYFAFYGHDVKDILRYQDITYVPGSPDFIYGIINVRGDIESVLNIHKLVGMPEEEVSNGTRIVIASAGDVRSGILVDSVVEVMDMGVNSVKPPITTIDKTVKAFVIGEILYDNRHVTLLDIGKIFEKIKA